MPRPKPDWFERARQERALRDWMDGVLPFGHYPTIRGLPEETLFRAHGELQATESGDPYESGLPAGEPVSRGRTAGLEGDR